ncbi:toxin-antitoxin system YwqK family antitoxin [Aneurinibacillus tyrosinisolvens]|uniref:toxin-antitoxin system YwqK family antitoxin n=1 Tax=Aneurinibacillus tyrosinisolvens TaxID=1443435 RepID=UPI000699355B|nr:hypothetical protein [Aneurinibacillus tyrosinisolvens]
MESKNHVRVDEELLEFDDDLRCYNDSPFSGIGYENYPNGNLKTETLYKDGFQHGLSREWYPTGEIKSEFFWKKGSRYSKRQEWHRNSNIKSIANYEWGIELDNKEWDENGNLIKSEIIDPNSPNYFLLLKYREINHENKND